MDEVTRPERTDSRPRHGIVLPSNSDQPLDLYDWRLWQHFGWGLLDPKEDTHLQKILPDASDPQERYAISAEHLRKSLAQAKRFHNALDIPSVPQPGTSIYLIAGDAKDTVSQLKVNRQGGLQVTAYAAGDETVLRSSALMDELLDQRVQWSPRLVSPVAWRHTTFLFTDHLGLTSEPAFTDNVLHLQLEAPR